MHATASRHDLDLRAENEELKERVRQLEQLLADPIQDLWNLPLTPVKRRLLGILYRTRGVVPRERLEASAHGLDSEVETKCLDVHLWALRKQIRPHGIFIKNVRGVGFMLPEDSRAKVQALIIEQSRVAAAAIKPPNGTHQGEQHAGTS